MYTYIHIFPLSSVRLWSCTRRWESGALHHVYHHVYIWVHIYAYICIYINIYIHYHGFDFGPVLADVGREPFTVYIIIFKYRYIHTHIYAYIYIYISTIIGSTVHLYSQMWVGSPSTCISSHLNIGTYIHIYMHMYIYIYIHYHRLDFGPVLADVGREPVILAAAVALTAIANRADAEAGRSRAPAPYVYSYI